MKLRLSKGLRLALLSAFCVAITLASGTAAAAVVRQVGNQPVAIAEDSVVLRWDSTAGESAVWDTENTAVWKEPGSGVTDTTFKPGSQVLFGEGADLNKSVQIASGHVTASTVEISGSDYRFSGGEMEVTDSLVARESATIDSALVMGSSSSPLTIDVAEGKVLTTNKLGTPFTESNGIHNHTSGSFSKIGGGTLRVTGDVPGLITEADVLEGKLELSSGVSMDVGANEITGGTLENVMMLVTGDIDRAVSGGTMTAHNIIKSADGVNAAVLTGVTLHAGTSTEYATLQNVSFAGASTLRGYITFEKTQRTGDMRVAAGGSLTVDNVCFDLHGLGVDRKVLIGNAAVNTDAGTLTGWDTASFVYSGIAVNSAAIDSSVAGVVTINALHEGNLYWVGDVDDKWNPGSANWSTENDGTGDTVFTALSNVYFGAGAGNRDITVTQDLVAMNLNITDGGYKFRGGRVATLGNADISNDSGSVIFHDQLVVQGSMKSSGKGRLELLGATTVVKDMTLGSSDIFIDGDVSVLGTFTVNAGSATDNGSLEISGNVTAQNMSISVFSDKVVGDDYSEAPVYVTGDLSVGDSGKITIGGTAEQRYLGVVNAGTLEVNTQNNHVYFDHLHVGHLTEDGQAEGSLTIGKGAHVHVRTSSEAVSLSSSTMPIINLSGTLSLDAEGATYNQGYKVYVQDDAAVLSFGTGCTIDNMQIFGKKDKTDTEYRDVRIVVNSHSATVTEMRDLKNLSVETGALSVQSATGAVHGELTLNNGKLKLVGESDNLMAEGAGALQLKNGAILDIGSTVQNLSAANTISLSGASSITGDAKGTGLVFADGASISYAGEKDAVNSISANMVVDHTLNISSEQSGSSLEISGKLSGSGALQLSGAGTVALSGANSFSGMVTVGENATLSLQNAKALTSAGVTLSSNGILSLDTDTAVYLNSLTFNSGATISFSTITATDDFSAARAALQVTQNAVVGSGTLNISFAEELDTLRTYNLLTGLSSLDGITLKVQHNGVDLHASQYKVGFDASSGLLYMQTFMGNVWEGQGESNIWSTANTDGNWSGKSNYNEDTRHKAAIFGDLNGDTEETVVVQGLVNPGKVYFVAESTDYKLSADAGGQLAEGTIIRKEGDATVQLDLRHNVTTETALGDIEVQDGTLEFISSAAVGGTVTVNSDVNPDDNVDVKLVVSNAELMMGPYTVSGVDGTLSGVTMDADGISGASAKKYGSAEKLLIDGNADLTYLNLKDIAAQGNVTLSHDTLSSSAGVDSLLVNVTIGEGVEVDASGSYTLSGMIAFVCTSKDDMLLNKGTITLADDFKAELGKAYYESSVNSTSGKTEYVYKLISLVGQGQLVSQGLQKNQVFVNGVNLAYGLNNDIVVDFQDNGNGSLTLSIGNQTEDGTSDGTVDMPQWDDNWGKTEKAPAFSRRYDGTPEKYVEYVELAADNNNKYSSIVNADNAARVNNGKAIAVTLAALAQGNLVVGGHIEGWDDAVSNDHEVWIYDRSKFENIVGGLDCSLTEWTEAAQTAATHILVDSAFKKDPDAAAELNPNNPDEIKNRANWAKKFIIGGSRWTSQGIPWSNAASNWQPLVAESYVTVLNGEIYTIFGGSCGGEYETEEWEYKKNVVANQYGTSHVFIEGGRIGEIFAAGMHSTLTGTQVVNGRRRAVEMVLTGGTLGGRNLRVFGGGERGTVDGDIYIRMEGDAEIYSRLLGGSNAGTVKGNIEMDLISGTAFRVDAAGLGWRHEWEEDGELKVYYEYAHTYGDVLVNLYSAFKLGHGEDFDLKAGIYGGMESTNYVERTDYTDVNNPKTYTSTLHFAEGATYALGILKDDNYTASENSIIVTGFDRITLEENAHARLALGYFDIDMDTDKPLYISGKGVVEVIGHGENFGRDIELQDGATLKVSTSSIGDAADAGDDRTIYVTSGTTLELTGYPVASGSSAPVSSTGLSFKTEICGDGVDGKGAIIKRTVHEEDDEKALSASLLSLPSVKLTGNASVGVMNHEVLHMCGYNQEETTLDLNDYTFTKQGLGTFVARNVTMSKGTVLVHQGDFYIDKGSLSEETDIVLSAGTSLHLNSGEDKPVIHTLSGAGSITLNKAELTLQTTDNAVYNAHYMDEAQSYDQFMSTTGFAHAVFSGVITDGSAGAGSLIKTGKGVHYISGSNNTYTGGTHIDKGRLYLLGTSAQSEFAKGTSSAASGSAGTGGITWSDKENAELYLGHGVRIYNNGSVKEQGGVMTIGVEGADGVLAAYVGSHSKGENKEYVEIKTHNLKSIAVDAVYADGTKYVAGDEIDRNKMLLVKNTVDLASVKVTGLSGTAYNEAIYSGVLSGKAKLHKVGVGTLVLDQSNSYSGGTEVSGGTLRVRGWGTLGENEKANSATVQDGATLMFTHNSGYGNEPTSAANDIVIIGSGDARWVGQAATDGDTAALISAVGPAVKFTLSGDISGSGNVRHSGEGVLVLSGDSSYEGGTYVSRGTVEVQSATGLGATAKGQGAVTVEHDADLRVTVEDGYAGDSMVTTLAADVNKIQGDVTISGTAAVERVLHMDGNGYNAVSTTLNENGTLLLNGAAIDGKAVTAESELLTGRGKVVVSDASASGASMVFDSMIDYTGDFRVEGDKASIKVSTGTYIDGSIHVAGKQASVSTGSDIYIADGESLSLRSTGNAAEGTSAALVSGGTVSVEAGAVFSVRNQATEYTYNISNLEESVSLDLSDVAQMQVQEVPSDLVYHQIGEVKGEYEGSFNAEIAINEQAVGTVQAADGLTLAGGATYETVSGNTSLAGGRLKLDTMEHSLLTFNTTPDTPIDRITGDTQLVLFSDVGGVDFGRDSIIADPNTGIYYTLANRYLTGCNFIDEHTLLIYDSHAEVVYLQMATVPEPTTATLSLLALAALVARRRRK